MEKSPQYVMAKLDERLDTASEAIDQATAQMIVSEQGGGGEAGAGATSAYDSVSITFAMLKKKKPAKTRRRARSGWVPPTEKQVEAAFKDKPPSKVFRRGSSSAVMPVPAYPTAFCVHPGCFARCPVPLAGEWLDDFNESGQTFREFNNKVMRAIPHAGVKVIEVVRVGPFDPSRSPDLDQLVAYASTFFCLEVRLSSTSLTLADVCSSSPEPSGRGRVTKKDPPPSRKKVGGPREGAEGQLQLECADVFDALRKLRSPRDVLCTVAVTMADLYPVEDGEAWNFGEFFSKIVPTRVIIVFQI